ncbi:MAG TPA: flagellar biosynthesis protein FlhF [Luteimonas sp.]|nr:flagellar biosynthesis protein FlhF [Luteimonas sp.]
MRIKRFTAPDMRTALRMIRDEQGPDAVILSNRALDDGIEVVAATDYDEALVAQALRAAAPGLETIVPVAPMQDAPAATAQQAPRVATSGSEAASFAAFLSTRPATAHAGASTTTMAPEAVPASVAAAVAVVGATRKHDAKPQSAAPARESLLARARAALGIGDDAHVDGPTLAELSAAAPRATATAGAPATAMPDRRADAPSHGLAETQRPHRAPTANEGADASMPRTGATQARAAATPQASAGDRLHPGDRDADAPAGDAPQAAVATPSQDDAVPAPARHDAEPAVAAAPRLLRAVPDAPPADPAIAAMREELARMRHLMEAQMEQLSLERLRAAPARAAAIDALLAFGCEDTLAQAVAAKLDPRLAPAGIREPMLAELARMLTVSRSEPIDDGGVIALVGPTGAGKTTTAAKLAARFAARHRARDVALVTTDGDRAGAREQLQAHGRRLGITVCEAAGPEGLQETLAQLVDYPLVLVDTAGHAPRDRALFGQILWLRASRKVRSLLVLPANAHPHDLGEVVRRYRPAAPEGVVLTKLDETGRLGSALSVIARHGLGLAYTTHGQQVPADIEAADADRLVHALAASTRAADNPFAIEPSTIEERHAAV